MKSFDLTTSNGQLGFNSDCVIALRILLTPTPPSQLALRHETLGTLLDLRQYPLSYFNFQLRVSPGSGTVPARLLKYDFGIATSRALLDGLCGLWSLWRRLLQRSGLPTPRKGLVTQARRGFSAPSPDESSQWHGVAGRAALM